MYSFTGNNPNKIYKQVLLEVLGKGQKTSPRGLGTFELQPACHHILEPMKRLCSVPGRRANPFFNMAENMWILAGKAESWWVCQYNNKLHDFQGDEGYPDFNAAYGKRIRYANWHRSQKVKVSQYSEADWRGIPQVDQLMHCYSALTKDKDSRQAVVSLWNPTFDYYLNETKDRPCNIVITFKIRNNKLNMTVFNRSNDVNLGLYGVNFVQFSMIQEFMAAALNYPVGEYHHISDSLHVYENNESTNKILNSNYDFDIYDYVEPNQLHHQDLFKLDQQKTNLGSFLLIPDEVISEEISFVQEDMHYKKNYFKYCRTNYAKACFQYLVAYHMQKNARYDECFQVLMDVWKSDFRDWVILGMEFILRKLEKSPFDILLLDFDKKVIDFININFEQTEAKAVLQYLHGH